MVERLAARVFAYAAAYYKRGKAYYRKGDYEAALRIKADYPNAKNNPDSARKARGY